MFYGMFYEGLETLQRTSDEDLFQYFIQHKTSKVNTACGKQITVSWNFLGKW